MDGVIWATPLKVELSSPSRSDESGGDLAKWRDVLQRAMTEGAGVLRRAASLAGPVPPCGPSPSRPVGRRGVVELGNLLVCAQALVAAATAREESRGRTTGTTSRPPSPTTPDGSCLE